MPLYDYRCKRCGYVQEVLVLPGEQPEVLCPQCESPMERIFSGSVGLVFKGSGFYVTDYKNKESHGKKKDHGSGKDDNSGG